MYPTTEVRWFMQGSLPDEVARWFERLGAVVEAEARTDRYLVPAAANEPGVKLREGQLQVKARTEVLGVERLASGVEGMVETYRKWSLPVAEDALPPVIGWADVAKTRRVRLFTPEQGLTETTEWVEAGCGVEVGEAVLGQGVWWTVCLEAFGPDAEAQRALLQATAQDVFTRPDAPGLDATHSVGYVGWLCEAAR